MKQIILISLLSLMIVVCNKDNISDISTIEEKLLLEIIVRSA